MAQGIQLPVVQTGLSQSINQAVKQVGTINIPATIDPSAFKNLAQPLGRVSGLATEFEKSIAASNARVLAFGASVGIINGVQGAFADLLKTGIEVQKTLTDIAAISGQSGRELSKFGDALFDVAKNTGQSFKIASQAALEFSRQGLSTGETIKRTNDALTLTRFTSLSAAEAVDALTAATNSFSETGVTTSQILNKLVAVDTKFAVSAEDLVKGLSRAGSIAQEAGLSIDELNAIITVTQERTARGGAVIGNAFKTILTNIRTDQAVEALRNIGIESLNAQGQLKGAIPLFQELAMKMKTLSGGERIQILETVASKYNINILSSFLDELNNANSKFGQAISVSANAGNQAYERQIMLNKTLAAELNRASVSATQLFNKLSEIGVTDSLATLLKFVNNLVEGFNKLIDSEGVGGNIARGLVKGISDVFFTVGLPIIAAIFVKLTTDIAKFGIESLKTILQINQQARERVALEQAVVNTLIRDQEIMATILALSGNRTKQEEYLLGVYNRQIAALQQVQSIASAVTPSLMTGGLSAMSGRITKKAAGGYLPAQEAADVRRGVGGASPSSKVVSIPNFAFGGGKRGTMIANTSEYVVPNFANGGSAIFNQNMVKAYGLPAGAKKISAAGGYVPNFANRISDVYIYNGKGQPYVSPKTGVHGADNPVFANSQDLRNKMNANPAYTKVINSDEIDRLNAIKQQKKLANIYTAQREDGAVMLVPNLSEAASANLKAAYTGVEPKTAEARKIASMVRFDTFGVPADTVLANSPSGKKDINYIEQDITDTIVRAGFELSKQFAPLGGSTKTTFAEFKEFFRKRGGAAGAASSAAGAIFESSIASALQIEADSGTTLDVPTITPKLKNLFKISGYDSAKADFKISGSSGNLQKFADQVVLNGIAKPISAAAGYIPNFATGSPLNDAINREMAAGLKPSQIRVTTDGRLKNSQNPNGFAVINTRDEPNGKIPNFADRRAPAGAVNDQGRSMGGKFTSTNYSGYNAPIGPGMAQSGDAQKQNDAASESTRLMLAFGALTMVTAQLESNFKDTQNGISKFVLGLSQAATSVAGYASIGSMLEQTSAVKKLAQGGGLMGGIAGNLTGIMSLVAAPLAIAQAYSDYEEEQTRRENEMRRSQGAGFIASTAKRFGGNMQGARSSTQAEIERLRKELQYERDALGMMKSGRVTGSGDMMEKQEQKVVNLQSAINNLKGEELRLTTEILNAQVKASDEEEARIKEQKDGLPKRIALQKQEISLQEAFEAKILSIETDRNQRLYEYTARYASLSDLQRGRIEDELKLAELGDREKMLRIEATKSILNQLRASGQLGVADEIRIKALEGRLNDLQDIEDVEKAIKDLNITGVINQEIIVRGELSKLKSAEKRLQIETDFTKSILEQQRVNKDIMDADKFALQAMRQKTDSQIELKNAALEYLNVLVLQGNAEEEMLRKQMASQPFSTPKQEADLIRSQLKNQRMAGSARITQQASSKSDSALKEVRSAFRSEVDSFTFLGSDETKWVNSMIEEATSVEQLKEAMDSVNAYIKSSILPNLDDSGGKKVSEAKGLFTGKITDAINKYLIVQKTINDERDIEISKLEDILTFEQKIALIREQSRSKAGLAKAFGEIDKEVQNFPETFAYNTTNAFRDGLRDAMSAAISQTDDLNGALQNVAMNFLKTMQGMFMNQAANSAMMGLKGAFPSIFNFAKGGLVSGGSGYRDDVPAMLTGGEFVMRKSAVQKYGAANLAKMNNGGIFLPGVRGGGAISGYDALRAFANQTTTSGATDVLRGSGSSAFANLEDQSSKLSRYALLNDDTINQEIRSAQEQGLNIISQREAYRTQQRKAMQQQLVSTVASAVLSAGIGALGKGAAAAGKGSATGLGLMDQAAGKTSFLNNAKPFAMPASALNFNYSFGGRAYGGMIRRYASGGPTDDVPALLMSGEYVMNRQTTSKYGKRLLDSMNQGRAPRFADGGDVGSSPTMSSENTSKMTGDVNISINVTGQNSETQTQGESNQGGVDYKKMSERIKAVVLETINEEKRLGGALRTR